MSSFDRYRPIAIAAPEQRSPMPILSRALATLRVAPLACLLALVAGCPDRPAPPVQAANPRPPASITPPLAPVDKPADLTIAFWNIEWLGKPEDRSGPARGVAQSPDEIAGAIHASGAAIVGLAEIVTRLPGRPIRSRELEAVVDALSAKSGSRWEYALNPGRSDGDQLTGVLWNAGRVTAVNASGKPWTQGKDEAWPIPTRRGRSSQGSGLWHRPPHAVKFSTRPGTADFVLIVVHMKADYQGDFAAHRREEAQALVDALPSVRKQFSDSDIIIIGDTNQIADREPAGEVFQAAGFTDLNPGLVRTNWRSGAMDRTYVLRSRPPTASSVFASASDADKRRLRIDDREFKRRFSDHFLITTTIALTPDDD
jgi:hypothetical protein